MSSYTILIHIKYRSIGTKMNSYTILIHIKYEKILLRYRPIGTKTNSYTTLIHIKYYENIGPLEQKPIHIQFLSI